MVETTFEKIEIKDWEEFVKYINMTDRKVPPKLGFVYRGQSDEEYDLEPSFNRHFRSFKFKSEVLLDIERIAQEEFKTQAHLYISTNLIRHTITVMDWWMLMQHHQAPTRLLDWTESGYVAAYHACEEKPDKNGAVWLLHGGYLMKKMKELYGYDGFPSDSNKVNDCFLSPDTSQEVCMVSALFKTDRMLAQQGLFSVCKDISGNQHEIIINTCGRKEEDRSFFAKLIIPCNMKSMFLQKLHKMNITASSLYPGLDGLGRSIKELVSMNALEEKVNLL